MTCRNRPQSVVAADVFRDTVRCFHGSSHSPPPCAMAKTAPARRHKRAIFHPTAPMKSRHPHRSRQKHDAFASIEGAENSQNRSAYLRQQKRIAQRAKAWAQEVLNFL